MKKEKSVSVSFSPPTEFARARNTKTDFAHPLLSLARQRAREFSEEVPSCAVLQWFARTYFENNGD